VDINLYNEMMVVGSTTGTYYPMVETYRREVERRAAELTKRGGLVVYEALSAVCTTAVPLPDRVASFLYREWEWRPDAGRGYSCGVPEVAVGAIRPGQFPEGRLHFLPDHRRADRGRGGILKQAVRSRHP